MHAGRLDADDLVFMSLVALAALGTATWAFVAVSKRESREGGRSVPGEPTMARVAFGMALPASLALPVVLLITVAYFKSPPRHGPTASPEPSLAWLLWDLLEDHAGWTLIGAGALAFISFFAYPAGRAGWSLLAMRLAVLFGAACAVATLIVNSPAW